MAREIDKSEIIRDKLLRARKSPLKAYRELTAGDVGLAGFIKYELLTSLLGGLPGGAGFLLRKKLYPSLLGETGRGVIIGRNVVLRHPGKIRLGDNVVVDDYCLLDGRGGDPGITLEDGVIINRNCMLQAKTGTIRMGARTTLGSNSVVVSMAGVELGDAVLCAGGVYISAGAYRVDDTERPIMDQEAYSKDPIRIGDHAWIGTGAIILDGVTIGRGAVIGAGAVVTRDIPDYAIAVGSPAKVIKTRKQ